jgi:Mn2+/Fe2+ NRAMP family transporter
MSQERAPLAKAIGPGLLFAGAAIGASHLVQSTRAGAMFGLALFTVVIFACALKYPAFSFGPRYAAATRRSLLEGYRRQGWWALALYTAVTALSMFTVQAAVTFVTAGLAVVLFDVHWDLLYTSAGLMLICAALLAIGHYRWLDRVVKVAVVILTVCTVLATVLVIPKIDWLQPLWPDADLLSKRANLLFVVALVGWMPSAIDMSVWHSLWTLARSRDTGHPPAVSDALLDFKIGYWATAFLGLCFVVLGAGVAYKTGPLPGPAGAFAARVVGLYTENLGEWSFPIIGGAAFLVMFSTTLTVVDGFPRALTTLVARFRCEEPEGGESNSRSLVYWAAALLLFVGSLILLRSYLKHLKNLVDLATSISLTTAPVLAWLNHRVVVRDLKSSDAISPQMATISMVCVVIMTLMALGYLFLRFG